MTDWRSNDQHGLCLLAASLFFVCLQTMPLNCLFLFPFSFSLFPVCLLSVVVVVVLCFGLTPNVLGVSIRSNSRPSQAEVELEQACDVERYYDLVFGDGRLYEGVFLSVCVCLCL